MNSCINIISFGIFGSNAYIIEYINIVNVLLNNHNENMIFLCYNVGINYIWRCGYDIDKKYKNYI